MLHTLKVKQHRVIVVICGSKQEAKRMATIICMSQAFLMIPHYMNKWSMKIRVKKIPGHCNPKKVLAMQEEHGKIVEDWITYRIPHFSITGNAKRCRFLWKKKYVLFIRTQIVHRKRGGAKTLKTCSETFSYLIGIDWVFLICLCEHKTITVGHLDRI